MHKEPGRPTVAHFRLLSDAMEELCSARTHEDVVRISGALVQRTSGVDGISLVLRTGEQFHYVPGEPPDTVSRSHRSRVISHIAAWVLQAGETAVVPDVHRDERTRAHTNGSTFARSLIVVPVGGRVPLAAVIASWAQEHWPNPDEVLVLEALSRAAGLALTYRLGQDPDTATDERDSVAEWLGTVVDADGLRGGERRHRLMVAELQHRVRNVLSLIRSIVRRTAQTSTSAEDYAAHLEGRISALGRTQGFVMREPGAGVDMEELVHAELIAHAARDPRVQTGGPTVRLKAKTAETLALALHELAANAVKFGALATPAGHISITWTRMTRQAGPCVRLQWVETGVAIDETPVRRRGFGSELLERTVPYELRGTSALSFDPTGIRCTIDIPLSADNVVTCAATAVE